MIIIVGVIGLLYPNSNKLRFIQNGAFYYDLNFAL